MRSLHLFHTMLEKQFLGWTVVITINVALLLSITGVVQASNSAGFNQQNISNRPLAGFATTMTASSAPNPSRYGEMVTITATVDAGAHAVTSGVVTFTIDSTMVVTQTVSPGRPGTATYTTNSLATNPNPGHAVQVDYFDDTGTFNSSSSFLFPNQVVNPADTTTMLASSNTSTVFGETVWLTATVSAVSPGAGTPTGSVQFFDNGSLIGTPSLLSGQASLSTSSLAVASHSITATYTSDPNFNASTSSILTQVVSKASTTTSLTTSGTPSVFGQSVTFTATVNAVPPGTGTPTGSVQFFDNGSPLSGAQSLSGGQTSFSTSALAVTSHSITAILSSDPNFNGSTSNTVTQVVNKAATTTSLATSGTPSVFGQSVTFTATVNAVPPGAGTPTGSVQFFDNGSLLGAPSLSTGQASLSTSSFSVASHSITATYLSNSNFNGSTSSILTQVVNKASTTTALASSKTSSSFGERVWFTATVSVTSPGAGSPTGAVQFKDGTNNLGSPVNLVGTSASISTTALSVGSHTISGVYSGDGNLLTSTGNLFPNMTVTQTNVSVVVSSSPNASTYNQSVNFTATVSSVIPGGTTPTGSIVFKSDGSTICCSVPLSNGTASISTSTLPAGSRAITADYGGDANYNFGTGTLFPNQTVNKANTLAAITGDLPDPSLVGQSVTVSYTVLANTPYGGTPTGNVIVSDGVSNCTATVAIGMCQITLTTAGARNLNATYQGDSDFNPSPPTVDVAHTVNKANTTATITGNSPNSSIVGQSVTITYSVSVNTPGSGTPTGNVVVSDGVESCIGTVAIGKCQIAFSNAGSKTLKAAYQGDGNYNASPASTGTSQTVIQRNTTTTVNGSINPTIFGQSTTFTATVSTFPPGFGTPTGTVQFKADGNNLGGLVTLSSGIASINTTALSVGTHTITAVYGGDSNFNSSTGTLSPNQVVMKANTATTITSQTPNPSLITQTVTVQFGVIASAPGSGTPTGVVTVTNGTNSCTGTVANGSCQISFTPGTNRTLTATFGGDNSFNASTSPSVTHGFWSPYTFFPMINNFWLPRAGAWKGPTNDEFNVSLTGDSIQGFAIYINVPSCNISNYRITHTTPEPIINNHFSFSGSFYADVTFDSPTTAHGFDGLTNYTIPNCVTGSGGPWNFTATWQSSTPIPFAPLTGASAPNFAEPASPTNGFTPRIVR